MIGTILGLVVLSAPPPRVEYHAGAKLRDASTLAEVATLFALGGKNPDRDRLGFHGDIPAADFSPDGKLVATAGGTDTAKVWDAATGKELVAAAAGKAKLDVIAFAPDGKTHVTAGVLVTRP